MPRHLNFKCSKCPWKGERHANASRCLWCGERLIREEEARDLKKMRRAANKMQRAIEAAYDHLDTYGFPQHPDKVLMVSQMRVFNLLRPFVKRPKPGCL